jgi:hypothetical protein
MSDFLIPATALCGALALVNLGGGLYEFSVVDPFWPSRPDLVQPGRGGISRKRFWIAAHTAFEVMLVVALFVSWSAPDVRFWLIIALASHAIMRIWSVVDFIPKTLAFEKAEPGMIDEGEARRWTRRSLTRLPLDLMACGAMLAAIITAARLG